MPPPPPPPPGAPPPPSATAQATVKPRDLLKDIQSGTRLRPTKTNDRSGPIVDSKLSAPPSSGPSSGQAGRGETGSSSHNVGPLPGIGGLFAGGIPTLKKTRGGIQTGRSIESTTSEAGGEKLNLGIGNPKKYSYNSTSSSLNSSPSPSPSPSPIGSSPMHFKTVNSAKLIGAPAPPTNKPSVPSTKPSINPRPLNSSPGPVHPISKPPPPPPNSKLGPTILNRTPISKSFNQTIGHGPQERPQIPNYGQRLSKDDTSITNGQIGGPPPPPVRTVSQTQINSSSRVPSRAPPPPPPTRPSHPPPPPPSNPPPAIPTFSQPPNKALPPPPPSYTSGDPPTPPMRRESIYRTGPTSSGYNSSASSTGESIESRFSARFKAIQFLPPPERFSNCTKTYPSKNTLPARQGSQIKRTPAPPPPPYKLVAPPPPPPLCKTELRPAPSKPPVPPVRQWSTTVTGVL